MDDARRWRRDEASVGLVGVLTVATRGAAGPGEVQVSVRGGSETFLAWSDEPLPRGTTVLVTESRGERALDVIDWTSPWDIGLAEPGRGDD